MSALDRKRSEVLVRRRRMCERPMFRAAYRPAFVRRGGRRKLRL